MHFIVYIYIYIYKIIKIKNNKRYIANADNDVKNVNERNN